MPEDTRDDDVVVRLEGVSKVFDEGVRTQVLFDIDLTVRRGEWAAIVGASGSGKTTLLNIIGLLDTPTEGALYLEGRDVGQLDEDARAELRLRMLGFIFQFHYLLPEYDVLENALMPCRIRGPAVAREAAPRVTALLEKVGLAERITYRPGQLSGGQLQRVAVVRAFSNNPRLVLADEPTGSLDSGNSERVFAMMRAINRETGTAFLMVTHDPALAAQMDRVIVLEDGRVVADGPPDEALARLR